jgi:hypothetical protein
MDRAIVASVARLLLVACLVAVVFSVVVGGLGSLLTGAGAVLPFLAAAVSVAGLGLAQDRLERVVGRVAPNPDATRYSALAEASARVREGSLEQALPGLARGLAEGTGARRAELWVAVEDRLVSAACHPPSEVDQPRTVENLGVLLARPETNHVVPVLDGASLRAVLVIEKPGRAVTPADQGLMHDVANGAGMLLRGVALNAELTGRVHRAAELADELQASRRRLAEAREVERRRLISELNNATTARLARLQADLDDAGDALDEIVAGSGPDDTITAAYEVAHRAIGRAREGLDELLERFRVIARGVYPAVLRDQGPYAALDELATDMPRPVLLAGGLPDRLSWELESGIYYIAASVMQRLASLPAAQPVRVHLAHADGRLSVRVDDPSPTVSVPVLGDELTRDAERLAALGGEVTIREDAGALVLWAWLPDHLAPSVQLVGGASG